MAKLEEQLRALEERRAKAAAAPVVAHALKRVVCIMFIYYMYIYSIKGTPRRGGARAEARGKWGGE